MKFKSLDILELDTKDKKILRELFEDGRASYAKIGKNIGISKDAVKYRIAKFGESGLMPSVNTIIDITKLGWSSALVFLKIGIFDASKQKKFTEYLTRCPIVTEFVELAGSWDFLIRVYYPDVEHLNSSINEIEKEFKGMIPEYDIGFILKDVVLPFKMLFGKYDDNDTYNLKNKAETFYKPDLLDLRILSAISFDSRKSLTELQNELKENRMTIHNRIKKLVDSKVIYDFRPSIYPEHLGYLPYIISVKLNDRSDEKISKVSNWLSDLEDCHFITLCFGLADCVFYCEVKTAQDLRKILYRFRSEFSADIKSIESAGVIKEYKWDFFPDGFLETYEKMNPQD